MPVENDDPKHCIEYLAPYLKQNDATLINYEDLNGFGRIARGILSTNSSEDRLFR
jgi:hypothetical protein